MLWNYFHTLPDQDGCQLLHWLQQHFPLCSVLSLKQAQNEWLSLIHPTLIPPGFTAALCLISCVHSEKYRAQTLLQGCACRAAGSEAGHTTPNAQKTFSACVVQVVSVQQRYPARELKFQGNSPSETKNMYKSSSNITLNQAKHFFKHLSSFI